MNLDLLSLTDVVSFSYLKGIPDIDQISDPNVKKLFKSLLKRDSTTKRRALSELLEILNESGTSIDSTVQWCWCQLYAKLSIDNEGSVRSASHRAQGQICMVAGKQQASKNLKYYVAPWVFGLSDPDKSVALAAESSLSKVFTSEEKRQTLLQMFSSVILESIEEILTTQKPETLSDLRFSTKDESVLKYNRLCRSAVLTLLNLFKLHNDKGELEDRRDLFTPFRSKAFWSNISKGDTSLAMATLTVVSYVLKNHPFLIEPEVVTQMAKAIFKGLGSSSSQSASLKVELLQAAALCTKSFPKESWSEGTKDPLKFLTKLLSSSPPPRSDHYWSSIMAFLLALPDAWSLFSFDCDSKLELLESLFIGVSKSRFNLESAWGTYLSVIERMVEKSLNNEQIEKISDLISHQVSDLLKCIGDVSVDSRNLNLVKIIGRKYGRLCVLSENFVEKINLECTPNSLKIAKIASETAGSVLAKIEQKFKGLIEVKDVDHLLTMVKMFPDLAEDHPDDLGSVLLSKSTNSSALELLPYYVPRSITLQEVAEKVFLGAKSKRQFFEMSNSMKFPAIFSTSATFLSITKDLDTLFAGIKSEGIFIDRDTAINCCDRVVQAEFLENEPKDAIAGLKSLVESNKTRSIVTEYFNSHGEALSKLWKLSNDNEGARDLLVLLDSTADISPESLVKGILSDLKSLPSLENMDLLVQRAEKVAIQHKETRIALTEFEWPYQIPTHITGPTVAVTTLGSALWLVEDSDSEGDASEGDASEGDASEGDASELLKYGIFCLSLTDSPSEELAIRLSLLAEICKDFDYAANDELKAAASSAFYVEVQEKISPQLPLEQLWELGRKDASSASFYYSRVLLSALISRQPSDRLTFFLSQKKHFSKFPMVASAVLYSLREVQGSSDIQQSQNVYSSSLIKLSTSKADMASGLKSLVLLNSSLDPDSKSLEKEELFPLTRLLMVIQTFEAWTSDSIAYEESFMAHRVEITKFFATILSSYIPASYKITLADKAVALLEQNLALADNNQVMQYFTLQLVAKYNGNSLTDDFYQDLFPVITMPSLPQTSRYISVVCNNIPDEVLKSNINKLYPLLRNPDMELQKSIYNLLHGVVVSQQTERSIEMQLDKNLTYSIASELASLVINSPKVDSDDYHTYGYYLAWKLIFDHFDGAAFGLKLQYLESMKDADYFTQLLEFLSELLAVDGLKNSPFMEIYIKTVSNCGALVRNWFSNLHNRRTAIAVSAFTEKEVSPIVLSSEFDELQKWVASDDEISQTLKIKVIPSVREVHAYYLFEEDSMEICAKLPAGYPLQAIQIVGVRRIGVKEKQWRAWLLASQATCLKSGSIIDAVELFERNAKLHFDGVGECAICYSILHEDHTLPTKECHTCKNKFHADCLYRWFKSGSSSTCPLCRSDFSFIKRRPTTNDE